MLAAVAAGQLMCQPHQIYLVKAAQVAVAMARLQICQHPFIKLQLLVPQTQVVAVAAVMLAHQLQTRMVSLVV
jgi:hypothetical protein